MPNEHATLHRLPPRITAIRYDGDITDLTTWVNTHRPNATVTATTDPVGAVITEQDFEPKQVVPGDVVLAGTYRTFDFNVCELNVFSDLGPEEWPPGFGTYPTEWLAEF